MAEPAPGMFRLVLRRLRAVRGRLTPRSMRARATLAACSVVAVALTAASLAMLALLHTDLRGNATRVARKQADEVAAMAAHGELTRVVPLGNGTDFVQVVSTGGSVLSASPNVVGRPPLASFPQAEALPVMPAPWELKAFGIDGNQQIVSVIADTPKGQVVIHAGVSLGPADAAESSTGLILAVGCPLLLLTVALVTWRVTGRALRPVEAIRSEVSAIGEQELHRRVPIPRGGDEISRLASTMNAMLDRLDVAGRRQRQFIADASHELRSPIAVLRTQLEVALAHPDPEVRTELVAGALEDTERLQALATDLLFLARLDSGTPSADRPTGTTGPVDLGELVRVAVRNRGAERCTTTLELREGVRVTGNFLWLTRLVTNLLDNAQRHAVGEIRVRVRADAASGDCLIEVHNDGQGIDPEDRERIFERFTRLDDARSRDHGGAGLGLPIARDVARHHGGTLAVVDSPHGVTFQARLPAAANTGNCSAFETGMQAY